MGIEYIELALDIEDKFDVIISDKDWETIQTVQNIIDITIAKVRSMGNYSTTDGEIIEFILAWLSERLEMHITAIKPEHDLFKDYDLG